MLEHGVLRIVWFVACGVVIEPHVRRAPFAAALIGSKEPPAGIESGPYAYEAHALPTEL